MTIDEAMEKKSLVQVWWIVHIEGLGYAVRDYLDAEDIEDEELRAAWKTASEAMDKIETILEKAKPPDEEIDA